MFESVPPETEHALHGAAGSLLALLFIRRPPLMMLGIFLGGCALAFFGAHWVSDVLGMHKELGLVGFLLGLFGMVMVTKMYDTIEAISPAELGVAIKDFIRKRLGV